MWQDTVTIFCKKSSGAGDLWFPYYLKCVDVNTDHSWLMQRYGESLSASCNLHIPCTMCGDVINIANYTYVRPRDWEALGNDERADKITFTGGNDACIILNGDYDFVGPIHDMDYRQGFLQYLKNNYDEVYSVISAKNYTVIPHFELVGR